jgi:pimeloyl-ACP methyl ester carboxylesterase
MIEPIGVERNSVVTSLGTMVYYSPTQGPWHSERGDRSTLLPTLVFLHGFGGGSSAYEWSKVYPAFAWDYRVLAPDLLGWGRSDRPPRNYRAEDYIKTIIEFIEKTCFAPTTVIASSLTAALTIRAAIERPDLFESLILTAPSGLSDFGEEYGRNWFTQLVKMPVVDRVLYNAGVANASAIRIFLEERQFAVPERIYSEMVDAYLRSAQQPNAEYAALSFVRGDLSFDLSLYIPQLSTPTAAIWGRESAFTSPQLGKRLAALNPDAIQAFVELKDVGLTPHLELPGVTIGLIRKFLQVLYRMALK